MIKGKKQVWRTGVAAKNAEGRNYTNHSFFVPLENIKPPRREW